MTNIQRLSRREHIEKIRELEKQNAELRAKLAGAIGIKKAYQSIVNAAINERRSAVMIIKTKYELGEKLLTYTTRNRRFTQ